MSRVLALIGRLDGIVIPRQHHAGVVEQDVQATEAVLGERDHGRDLLVIGDVDVQCCGGATGVGDHVDRLLVGLVDHVGSDNAGALFGHAERGRPTHTTSGARDHRDLAGEPARSVRHERDVRASDALEVALVLPVGDGGVPRRQLLAGEVGVVVDHVVAESRAGKRR